MSTSLHASRLSSAKLSGDTLTTFGCDASGGDVSGRDAAAELRPGMQSRHLQAEKQSSDAGQSATVLGVPQVERDASRIIMAAQLRLRLLRQSPQTRHVRFRVAAVTHARDVLLRRAVEFSQTPAARRSQG
jgi:hypothetical protein